MAKKKPTQIQVKPRSHMAIAFVGRKHTGKSTTANKVAEGYEKKKVLIIDPNGAPAYAHHPVLTYEQLPRFKGGIAKFYDINTERMFKAIYNMLTGGRSQPPFPRFDGMIIFEDCTKLIGSNPTKIVKSILVDHRMFGMDVSFTFHSLKRVPSFFWDMLTHVVIFKTQDMIETNMHWYSDRIPNFEAVYKEWRKVMDSKDDFENHYVETLL